jgi:hypothetical protein
MSVEINTRFTYAEILNQSRKFADKGSTIYSARNPFSLISLFKKNINRPMKSPTSPILKMTKFCPIQRYNVDSLIRIVLQSEASCLINICRRTDGEAGKLFKTRRSRSIRQSLRRYEWALLCCRKLPFKSDVKFQNSQQLISVIHMSLCCIHTQCNVRCFAS